MYLDAFGQPMIILGTHEAAIELLDRRASNYSNRKFSSMAELSVRIRSFLSVWLTYSRPCRTGLSWLLGTVPYGDRWRGIRRHFHQHMNANAVVRYRPIQERQTRDFLLRLLENPKHFSKHGRVSVSCYHDRHCQ